MSSRSVVEELPVAFALDDRPGESDLDADARVSAQTEATGADVGVSRAGS